MNAIEAVIAQIKSLKLVANQIVMSKATYYKYYYPRIKTVNMIKRMSKF